MLHSMRNRAILQANSAAQEDRRFGVVSVLNFLFFQLLKKKMSLFFYLGPTIAVEAI